MTDLNKRAWDRMKEHTETWMTGDTMTHDEKLKQEIKNKLYGVILELIEAHKEFNESKVLPATFSISYWENRFLNVLTTHKQSEEKQSQTEVEFFREIDEVFYHNKHLFVGGQERRDFKGLLLRVLGPVMRDMMKYFNNESEPKVEPTEVFNCPSCPNQGWYADGYQLPDGEFEPQQVQCEFCYTHPQSVFNYMQKVKVSDFKIINETGEDRQ